MIRKRGEADGEDAWTAARPGAGAHRAPQAGPSRRESGLASRPLRSVIKKRGAVVSRGLRPKWSKSGEAPRGPDSFCGIGGLRTAPRRANKKVRETFPDFLFCGNSRDPAGFYQHRDTPAPIRPTAVSSSMVGKAHSIGVEDTSK